MKMPRTTPRAAPPDESITQTTQASLRPHLQLCSIFKKIPLGSWDADSRIRDCSSKVALSALPNLDPPQKSHPWQHYHAQGEPQAHSASYFHKRPFLQTALFYTLDSTPSKEDLVYNTVANQSVSLPSKFEGNLLFWASSAFPPLLVLCQSISSEAAILAS